MPELGETARPNADTLRRAVLRALKRSDAGLRVVVEDVLGETSRIDAVALDGRDQIVAILIAADAGDAGPLTRGLAARAWLADHIEDWAKLAPQLKLPVNAPVGALILAPDFPRETRSAAESLPRGFVECLAYRPVRLGSEYEVVLEAQPGLDAVATPAVSAVAAAPGLPRFRSGLSDSDLGLSPEEKEHFDSGP